MTVAAVSVATLGAATAVVPAQAAPTGEPCYSYNKRTVENTVIRLWRWTRRVHLGARQAMHRRQAV
jgi:hypothetical protein